MKNPPSTGRIYGTLDKPRLSRFTFVSNPTPRLPDRKGVVLVAEDGLGRFTAAVGADLKFDFPSLPPGKYQVRVEGLPTVLAVDAREVEVHGGSCNELALFTESSASIGGYVVGAGKLPQLAQIFLVSANNIHDLKRSSPPWVMTDAETGAFLFKHVVPGKYVLGFELGHSPTLDVPYASRFFPEGLNGQKATLIELHSGEQIKDLKFDVGKEVARRRVRVRVTWADGSPAANATAYLRDAHNPYSSVADKQTPTDAKGEAILEGFVDTDYDVDANAVCKGRSISNQIEKKIIPASPAEAFVELIIKGRKCPLVIEQKDDEND
jgi:hypothetical protein